MNQETLEMKGLSLLDVDDTKVGDVVDFYVDGDSKEPEWLVVETGVLEKKNAVVPLEGVSREDDKLKTPYPKEMILSAPSVNQTSIDKATEDALYGYYHVRRELPGRTQQRAAFDQDRSTSDGYRLRSWKSSAA